MSNVCPGAQGNPAYPILFSHVADLHLVEADVAGIGAPPRRPMVAEDIRPRELDGTWPTAQAGCGALPLFLGVLRGSHSKSSGLSMAEIMPVATRV